jgi:hypothetical protein
MKFWTLSCCCSFLEGLGSVRHAKVLALYKSKLSYDRRSVGQSPLVLGTHLGPATNFPFFSFPLHVWDFVDVWCSLWREDVSMHYVCCWASPVQPFSGPNPAELITTFYGVQSETLPTWRAKSKSCYDWRSVGQSVSQCVLMSSLFWLSWPIVYYRLTVTV